MLLYILLLENFKCIPSHGKFQCPVSGICIPLTSVCDHSADCQSAKDEGYLFVRYLLFK